MVIRKDRLNLYMGCIVTTMLLYSNLVIANAEYLNYVLIIVGLSTCYCIILLIKSRHLIRGIIMSKPYQWIILFSALIFIYGYYGKDRSSYSLQFQLLNICTLTLLFCISFYFRYNILDLISISFSGTIILTSLFIINGMGYNFLELLTSGNRVGNIAVGNVNTTGITYVFLLIPVAYRSIYRKEKKYVWILLIGLFFMLTTGSKKTILSVLVFLLVCVFVTSKNINRLTKNILLASVVFGLLLFFVYSQPYLYEILWVRIENMLSDISSIGNAQSSATSTNLRMHFIETVLTKTWDKPIWGHGWNSFASMYGYVPSHNLYMYSHCNYTEILFSFGLVGLILFYYLPFKILFDNRRISNQETKLLVALFCVILLFIDTSAVTYYQSILGFYGIALAYIILHYSTEKPLQKEGT